MANTNERCRTYLNCVPLTETIVQYGSAGVLIEIPCISTENVQATQNKTQLPACRGVSEQFDTVESTSFTATGQIELRSEVEEAFANMIFQKACNCLEVCMIFLTGLGDFDASIDLPLLPLDQVAGKVICGVPDATWNRDNSNKSLSFTITPTSFAGSYQEWRESLDFFVFTPNPDGILGAFDDLIGGN